jgi:hypothetical protein
MFSLNSKGRAGAKISTQAKFVPGCGTSTSTSRAYILALRRDQNNWNVVRDWQNGRTAFSKISMRGDGRAKKK